MAGQALPGCRNQFLYDGFRDSGLGSRVQGLVFRAQGLRLRTEDLGFRGSGVESLEV